MAEGPLPLHVFRGLSPSARRRLRLAQEFGQKYLSHTKRRSGERYALHGCEVAGALRELTDDPSLLIAAILHDLLVLPEGRELLKNAPITTEERELVRGMHPLRRLSIDANTDDLDRVIAAFTDNARLLPLRMAHRVNDIRHLKRFSPEMRHRLARETLHMYTSIAGRLSLQAWRHEMEEACFPVLQPDAAGNLRQLVEEHRPTDLVCMHTAERFIKRRLREHGITGRTESRIKGLYSTYWKMIIKHRTFDELTDRIAIRIIVRNLSDCYRALGIVHDVLHPIPGKLKDYIGAPKENGYQSIHTVVYPLPGVTERPIEIQIRTEEMHRECQYGFARHGDYKSYIYALNDGRSRVHIFRNLQVLRDEVRTPKQFEEALRTYFRQDHVTLFDAGNRIYHLKKPLTALDFVSAVHGKRVRRLKKVRINGQNRPIDTKLRDGDTVEATFGRHVHVSREWVEACLHRTAKHLLRQLMRKESMINNEKLKIEN